MIGYPVSKNRKSADGFPGLLAVFMFAAGLAMAESPGKRVDGFLADLPTARGMCVDVRCGSGNVLSRLVSRTGFLVHGVDPDDANVDRARTLLLATGQYGRRVSVERCPTGTLPQPDYCANLVVNGDGGARGLDDIPWREIYRILAPERGLAWIGMDAAARRSHRVTPGMLKARLEKAGIASFEIVDRDGLWVKIHRPRPEGVADWTHDRRCTPDNNPCSQDDLARAPFQTLWVGRPFRFTKFGLVLASHGRYFLRHGGIPDRGMGGRGHKTRHELVQAFDGYNGTLLWEHRLEKKKGTGFVATRDVVLALTGPDLLVALHPETGQVLWKKAAADMAQGMGGVISYAADGGVAVVGVVEDVKPDQKKAPPMNQLVGLCVENGHVLWTYPSGVRQIVLGLGLVAFCDGRHIRALHIKTGKEAWSHEAPKAKRLLLHQGRLYTERDRIYAFETGEVLRERGLGRFGTIAGGRRLTIHRNTFTWTDLLTGERVAHQGVRQDYDPFNPKCGIPNGTFYSRCIPTKFSKHCLFSSASGTVVRDLDSGAFFPMEAFRSNCRTGVIAANGLAYNSATGCRCTLAVQGSVGLLPVTSSRYEAEADATPQLEKGPAYSHRFPGPGAAEGDTWPAFRHDSARGNVTRATLGFPLEKQWVVSVAPGVTPPAVAGGMVFVGARDHAVYALNAQTGAVAWRYVTGGEIAVTPTYRAGRVYAGSQDGWVYCLRADTGALVWRFRGGPFERKAIIFGRMESVWPVASGVLVDNGVAYFCAGRCNFDRVFVYALNAATGAVLWRNDRIGKAVDVTGPETGVSPCGVSPSGPMAASKDTLFIPNGPSFPAGIRRSDGAILWWNRRGDSAQRSNINIQHLGGAELAVGGGLVFAGGRGRLTAHHKAFIAVSADNGRIWGQDHPGWFKRMRRDEQGENVKPLKTVWGVGALTFGGGSAPAVADGLLLTQTAGTFVLADYLNNYLAGKRTPARWKGPLHNAPFVVAGDCAVRINSKAMHVVSIANGKSVWSGATTLSGPVAENGLAVANGALYAVFGTSNVVCFSSGPQDDSGKERDEGVHGSAGRYPALLPGRGAAGGVGGGSVTRLHGCAAVNDRGLVVKLDYPVNETL